MDSQYLYRTTLNFIPWMCSHVNASGYRVDRVYVTLYPDLFQHYRAITQALKDSVTAANTAIREGHNPDNAPIAIGFPFKDLDTRVAYSISQKKTVEILFEVVNAIKVEFVMSPTGTYITPPVLIYADRMKS